MDSKFHSHFLSDSPPHCVCVMVVGGRVGGRGWERRGVITDDYMTGALCGFINMMCVLKDDYVM